MQGMFLEMLRKMFGRGLELVRMVSGRCLKVVLAQNFSFNFNKNFQLNKFLGTDIFLTLSTDHILNCELNIFYEIFKGNVVWKQNIFAHEICFDTKFDLTLFFNKVFCLQDFLAVQYFDPNFKI